MQAECNTHLDIHENDKRYSKWRDLFKANTPHKAILSDEVFKLVKLFISANISISQLKNPFFFEALDKSIREKCRDYHTFRNKILPEVMKMLFNAIQLKLQNLFF